MSPGSGEAEALPLSSRDGGLFRSPSRDFSSPPGKNAAESPALRRKGTSGAGRACPLSMPSGRRGRADTRLTICGFLYYFLKKDNTFSNNFTCPSGCGKLLTGDHMDRAEILDLLFATPYAALRERAEKELCQRKGSHVFVRGLIEFSNICRRNCRYCGLQAHNRRLPRYTLSREEILDASVQAVRQGADTIVLQSGEYAVNPHWLADVIESIVQKLHVPVTLCVGEQPREAYALWKEAGAERYLMKHETADAALYARLHPGYTLEDRLKHLHTLRELGYEIGSGFMVGLPGQDPASLADDILLARDLRVGMCGAGPFIPQKDTPLGNSTSGSAEMTLRVLAVLRLALPWANLPATTALATVDPSKGQKDGLLAGANVLMPGFTPLKYQSSYCLYDHKNRVSMECARRTIEEAGRTHQLKPWL